MKKIKNVLVLSILSIIIAMPSVNAETNLKIGDYVSMTPTSTSFIISANSTGYDSDQTINPSELNLWRVIRINEDNTVDMVTEYVSSKDVYFKGLTGYQNYIGTLNNIAKQYENSKYTLKSRYMGYNGQTEYITDTSKLVQTTLPWASYTKDNSNELQGGGDMLYLMDLNLVKAAIGSFGTSKVGTNIISEYWLAGRDYTIEAYTDTPKDWYIRGRCVSKYEDVLSCLNSLQAYYNGSFRNESPSFALRPIVTLKSDVTGISGTGTIDEPWELGIPNEEEVKKPENSNNDSNVNQDNNSNIEQKSENKNEIKNPQTGVTFSIIVLVILGTIAIAIKYFVKKKSLFRKI